MDYKRRVNPSGIVLTVVVAIVFFAAGYFVRTDQTASAQPPPTPSPRPSGGNDGDPVGFKMYGAIPVGPTTGKVTCLLATTSSGQCYLTIQYTTPLASTAAPTCNPGVSDYCVPFKGMMTIEAEDENNPPSTARQFDVTGTISLK